MKEESYQLLEYLVNHVTEGTVTPLVTEKGIPILLIKEKPYILTVILCVNDEAKKITKEYTKTTLHKALYDLISDIENMLSQNIEELKIAQKLSFDNCLPKREVPREQEVKKRGKQKPQLPSLDEYKKNFENEQKHVIPLFQIEDKKYMSLILESGIIDVLELTSTLPQIISKNQISTYKINNIKTIYTYLSIYKLDINNKINPISTVTIDKTNLTFFTALYSDQNENTEQIEINLFNKYIKLNKNKVKLFSINLKGNLHVENVDILRSTSIKPERNGLKVGLFIKRNNDLMQIGEINLGELHEKNVFTINEYIYGSLMILGNNDYTFFDNILMKLVNVFIAKSSYSKLTRDIIERETNINYSIPFLMGNMGNKLLFANPILYWYSKEILGNDEICNDCPAIQYSQKFDELLNSYRKLGYFKTIYL